MLTRLRIQNFKAWKDTGDIRLAPLTVFFGTNSSGKTSLQQFLLLLQQTAQSRDRKRVLHFGDDSTLVDQGVFPQMFFRQDPSALLRFEIDWRDKPTPVVMNGIPQRISAFPRSFECVIGREAEHAERLEVKHFSYEVRGGAVRIRGPVGMSKRAQGEGYELILRDGSPLRLEPAESAPAVPEHFYGFPNEVTVLYRFGGDSERLVYDFEKQLDAIHWAPARARRGSWPLYGRRGGEAARSLPPYARAHGGRVPAARRGRLPARPREARPP